MLINTIVKIFSESKLITKNYLIIMSIFLIKNFKHAIINSNTNE
jgi:hypothetical protein